MANWRRKIEMGAVATALGGVIVAGGYGVASAATSSGHHAPTVVSGVVSNASSGGFTVTNRAGTATQVATTTATVYRETGSPVAPSGVIDGEYVVVHLARDGGWSGGTTSTSTTTAGSTVPDASVVEIVLAGDYGVVRSVGDGTFTLQQWRGRTVTVDTTGSTAYYEHAAKSGSSSSSSGTADTASTVTGVQTGEFVAAYGSFASPGGPLDASIVDIWAAPSSKTAPGHGQTTGFTRPAGDRPHPTTTATTSSSTRPDPSNHSGSAPGNSSNPSASDTVTGKVASVAGDVITVTQAGTGTTWTVTTDGSTAYNDQCDSSGSSSSSPVVAGDVIKAVGTSTGPDALTASAIDVYGQPSTGQPPAGQTPPQGGHQGNPGQGSQGTPPSGNPGHQGGGPGYGPGQPGNSQGQSGRPGGQSGKQGGQGGGQWNGSR